MTDPATPAAHPRTISVDFDGVIHHYTRWEPVPDNEPVAGAIDALRALQTRYAVVVHTARNPSYVVGWLAFHGIAATEDDTHHPCYGLGCDDCDRTGYAVTWNDPAWVLVSARKFPAVYYIDDRAIEFTDWASTLSRVDLDTA